MRRYLLVLDMDLLKLDEDFDLQPINHLARLRQEQPCAVVVLSLVSSPQLPAMEMLLGAQVGKMPMAPAADHDLSAAAEHRMNLAVRHLTTIGCAASGLISDEDLITAVRAETRIHDYEQVILATERPRGSWLARVLRLDPISKLRWRWGRRLIVFPRGLDATHPEPAS